MCMGRALTSRHWGNPMMTRRDFIHTGLLTAATSMSSGRVQTWFSPATPQSQPRPPRGKGIRVAHVTDAHVEPGGKSAEGLGRCLTHVHKLERPPDLILNGGDAIMDAFKG